MLGKSHIRLFNIKKLAVHSFRINLYTTQYILKKKYKSIGLSLDLQYTYIWGGNTEKGWEFREPLAHQS